MLAKNAINRTPSHTLTSSLSLNFKPAKNLEFILNTGYTRRQINEFIGSPTSTVMPGTAVIASSTFTNSTATSWSFEPQVNYRKELGKGTLMATAGASLQNQDSNTMTLVVSGFSSDALLSSLTAGTTITTLNPYTVSPRKSGSLFGRLNYNWAQKYYFDVTGRDDGSSNFGQNRQYHLFAAVGAGWIFSEESLIKKNLSFLSFGKLRGSYGSTGRDNLPAYAYLSTYRASGVSYSGVAALTSTLLPNPDLAWETTKKAEIGLELQFLKGRIAVMGNFYRNITTNVLANTSISTVTGFNTINQNIPAKIQNQGFDVTLTTNNITSKNFSWSTNFVFTRDRNKLVDYPNLANSAYANVYVIGQPVDVFRLYRFAGVNPQTGLYQVYGANGAIAPAPNQITDKTSYLSKQPDYYGSIQNTITFKQFSLSFLFRGIKQIGWNAFRGIGTFGPGFLANTNFNTVVLNRWQKPGDVTGIQRYGTGILAFLAQNNASQSDATYGDASFIRLQNVSLTYTLPQSVISKLHLQNLQVFFQGQNLLTITRYNGLDPETQSIYSLPPLRVMTAGIKLTL